MVKGLIVLSSSCSCTCGRGGGRHESDADRPEVLLPLTALGLTLLAFALVPTYTDSALASFDVYNTLQIFARLGLIALALGLTMIAGEFDLSVVGTYALGGMLTVQAGQEHWSYGLLAAVGAGAAIGLVQGGLIASLWLPSMPVTLATYIALLGLTSALSGGLTKTYSNVTSRCGSTRRC